jgi:hypothetical protein
VEPFSSFPASLIVTSPASPYPNNPIAGSVLPIKRAEELLGTLPGIISVRIVPSDAGAIDEIHVLTSNEVQPKQTVRNIESALIAQLGLRVNHRKISVATTLDPILIDRPIEQPPMAPRPAPVAAAPAPLPPAAALGRPPIASRELPPVRESTPSSEVLMRAVMPTPSVAELQARGRRVLVFDGVEVRRSRTRGLVCKVMLRRGDDAYSAEAEGQDTDRARVELSARATVEAIVQAVGGDRGLVLEGTKIIAAFDREFVFVSVQGRIGREQVTLAGTAEVRESAETASVLAVLDATNRWVLLER